MKIANGETRRFYYLTDDVNLQEYGIVLSGDVIDEKAANSDPNTILVKCDMAPDFSVKCYNEHTIDFANLH